MKIEQYAAEKLQRHLLLKMVIANISFKHLALIPFVCGIVVLGYYYVYWKPKHRGEQGNHVAICYYIK